MASSPKYYIVEASALPEVFIKVAEAKRLLSVGEAATVNEATRMTGISRSAFYKYRDAVFPFRSIVQERILTVFVLLQDRKGTLAKLLETVSEAHCNILTIHQTIPIQGRANVTLSLDVTSMTTELDELIQSIKRLDFVESADVISSGAL